MWRRSAFLLAAAAATAATADAQVRVTTLAEGDQPVSSTQRVRVSRFADLSEANFLAVGDALAEGDLLTALDPAVLLELTCPQGSLLHFGNGFRVLVQPAAAADCAAAFLAGDLDVLTEAPTAVGLGGKTVGTGGTRYAVRLGGSGGAAEEWVWVFEGKVEVAAKGEVRTVGSGRRVDYQGREAKPSQDQPISESEVQHWAGRYAEFDVVKARAAGLALAPEEAASTRAKLAGLYAEVLAKPDDKQARIDLARIQIDYRVGAEAIHNLKRAGVDEKALDQQKIDPEALRRGDPEVKERLDLLLRDSGRFIRPDLIDVADRRPAEPPADDLAKLLDAGAYAKVIEIVDARRKSGGATAREYCLAARAYAATGDGGRAGGAARRGLRLAEQGEALAGGELSICRDLAVKYGAAYP
jgi:hypothetical protein